VIVERFIMAKTDQSVMQLARSFDCKTFHDSGKTLLASEKMVRFNLRHHVIDNLQREDMTQSEISNTWYDQGEITKMKRRFDHDIQLIKKGRKLDDITIRGLEASLSAKRTRRAYNRLNAVISVLDEQERQILQGDRKPERIRNVYLRFSQFSQSEAHKIAKADEREVQNIYHGGMKLSGAQSIFQKHESIRNRKELLFAKLFVTRKNSQL
jgi:hypothetical protein